MEKVIDRKEYRRNSEKERIIEDEQVDVLQKKIRKFLLQTLGAAILLLVVSFLRFYNCAVILEKIDSALNTEITITSLQKGGQRIYKEVSQYYLQLNHFIGELLKDATIKSDHGEDNLLYSGENVKNDFDVAMPNIASGDELWHNESSISTFEHQYESAVEGINQMSEDAKYINENYKFIIPVIGTITSRFGVRNSTNPIVSHYHSGIDIAANTGTQIIAALDGEVIEVADDTYFGKYLKIKKDDIEMIYAHCSKIIVKVGEKVPKGKLIAYVGNTGNSTGPHLHFELKYQDRLVNPVDILDI